MPDNKENKLIILSMDFAKHIIALCDNMKQNNKSVLINQLLRSGTSIGANIHEANYAQSKADFISKFQIALKEAYETEYWLELFLQANYITEDNFITLKNSCGTIRKLLISSVNTAKSGSNTNEFHR